MTKKTENAKEEKKAVKIVYFDMSKFAQDIIAKRKELGLVKSVMAEKLQLNLLTLDRYENEKSIPRPDHLYQICQMLRLDPKDYHATCQTQPQDIDAESTEAFDKMRFAMDLKNARKELHLTQADIVEKYKISKTLFGSYEREGCVSTEMLYKLCVLFDLDVNIYFRKTRQDGNSK